MFAIPVSEQLQINRWILVAVAGALMIASTYRGINALAFVSKIAVPAVLLLCVFGSAVAISRSEGASSIFGKGERISVLSGVTIVIGTFVSGGTMIPNFTRFAKTKRIAWIATVIAIFFGNGIMLNSGAIGTVASMFLYQHFIRRLNLLGSSLPPIGAILAADFFLNRAHYVADEKLYYQKRRSM